MTASDSETAQDRRPVLMLGDAAVGAISPALLLAALSLVRWLMNLVMGPR